MENGFIRDMLDVKVLILYVISLAGEPLDIQKIYELSFVDNRLTYFDVCEAVPELKESGHLCENSDGTYSLTGKGAEALEITLDSLAYTVRTEAKHVVDRFLVENEKNRRTRVAVSESQNIWYVTASYLDDKDREHMLKLPAETKEEARRIAKVIEAQAGRLFAALSEDIQEEIAEE